MPISVVRLPKADLRPLGGLPCWRRSSCSSWRVGASAQATIRFPQFLEGLWPEAQAMGVSRATFDAALRGVEPDLALPDLVLPGKSEVKGQAEFTKTPAQYLSAPYLAKLERAGQDPADAARRRGSPRSSASSACSASSCSPSGAARRRSAHNARRYYVVKALATQAYLGRRKDMFRTELLYALKMLQDGVRTRETMTASWAGAMGLTQFMPSEYYTRRLRPRRRRPQGHLGLGADALASAANQLRAKGWVPNQTWGYEVRLPKDVSCLQEGADNAKPLREWVKLGVARARAATSRPMRSTSRPSC